MAVVASLALGWLGLIAPGAAAASPPTLYKFLGSNSKNDGVSSEFRADFIVRVATGETITSLQYRYSPGGGNIAAGEQTAAVFLSSIDQNYAIMSRITNGPYDYLGISLHGDADWAPTCANGVAGLTADLPIQVTTASGTATISNPITAWPTSACSGVSRPVLPTTWDNAWNSAKGTSADGWGLNVGSNGLNTGIADTGRFILDAVNPNAATLNDCGVTTTVYYEWVDQNNNPVASLTPAPVPLTVPNHGSYSTVVTSPTSASLENGTSVSTAAGFPATFNFNTAGPGYYKLLAWPVATSTGPGAVSCTTRTFTPGSIADAWQMGSVWNNYALPVVPAPLIAAPVAGGFVNTTTPVVSGTGVAGDTVTVTEGTTTLCTTNVAAGGTWSCASAALSVGSHTIRATQANPDLVVSAASTAVAFTVDTTAPAAPVITAPPNNFVTTNPTPNISGTGEALATVTVRDGTTVVCTATVAAAGAWSCTSATLSVGTHALQATQTDRAGNVSPPSNIVNVRIVVPPPVPVITAPVTGSYVNSATPVIRGTGVAGDIVTVTEGTTTLCTAVVAAGGSWSCTPTTSLPDGPHSLTATQADPAGNVSPASAPTEITVDTAAPVAPVVTAPAAGPLGTGTPSISGTGEPGATVTVRDGATVLCTATVAADGSWSCTPATALGEGPHSLTATQADPAGNVSPASAPTEITVDTAAPVAPVVTGPPAGALNTGTPTITGTGEPGATVTVRDGAALLCTAVVAAGGSWSCTPGTALVDGPHSLTATQADPAGNVSAASAPVAVTVDTAAPAAPVVTAPAAGPLGTGTPSITGAGEPGATVTVRDGATVLCTAVVAAGGSWSCTPTTALLDGPHSLTATQADPAGNVSAASAPVAVTVDTAAPVAPVVTGPAAGPLGTGTPSITGTGEPGATVTVRDGATVVCTAAVAADGSWSCTPGTALSDGPHSLTATQADPAGNVSPASAPVAVTVDTAAPAAPVVTGPPAGALNTGAPTITGTGEPGATVTVRDGATVVCSAAVAADGSWSCTPGTALVDGPHSLTATQADPAGNVSPGSAPTEIAVDTAAPVAPVVTGPTAGPLGTGTPSITGTGEPGATVTVRDGARVVCTAVVAADGSWSCTPGTALSDGPHSLTATQADPAGNVSPASPPVAVTVDTAAPAAPVVTAPAAGPLGTGTPSITGTGEPGATVTVRDGAAVLCTATVAADGSWSCTPGTALVDGPHSLTATQADPAGNVSPASPPVAITVDTAAPAAPVVTGPLAGPLGTGTPTVSGTGEPGATVTVRDGAAVLCTATVAADGSWSCTPGTALVDGPHSLTATQADPAGNVSAASAPVAVTVDTAAPAAPVVTGPPAGALNTGTPTITGTGEPGATVTVRDGAAVLCTATVAADGSWSCTPGTALVDGPHSLTATQADPAGNVSAASAPVAVTVDTAAPVAPVVTGPAAGPLGTGTPSITGTGEPGATVTVRDGATVVCTAAVAADGSWSCTPGTALSDGPHSLTATQADPAGNVSPASAPVAITVDTAAPAAPVVTGPPAGALNTGTPTITGTGEPGATVTVRDGAAVLCTATVAADGSWSCTPMTALLDGPHSLTATQADRAGNVSPASPPVAITVDTAAPAAPAVTSPAAGPVGIGTPTVSGTGEPGATVTVRDGATVVCTATVAVDGSWSCTPGTALADGPHTITATQADLAGNVSPASAPVAVTVDTSAPAAPVVTGPPAGPVGTGIPTVSGTGEPGATVTVRDGAAVLCTATVAADGSWSCTPGTALPDGPHSLTATQADPAGNVSAASAPVAVTVDTAAPAAPVVTGPPAGALNTGTPTITGTGEPGATVTVRDGATGVCTAAVAADGSWSCAPGTALSDGPHSLTATQADPAGNVSPASAPVEIAVDTAAPVAPVVTGPPAGALNTGTPSISGTGEPGATVTVRDGATVLCTATVAADGSWSCTPGTALSDGPHSLTATQADPAGNVSPASAPTEITVDTAAPVAPVVTGPPAGALNTGTPTITGTGEPGATVTVRDGAALLCTAVVAAGGSWTCTPTSPLPDGRHSLTATQADLAGNVSAASAPVAATVDTAAPAAPVVTGPPAGALNTGTPTITGTGEPGATVTVRDGAALLCTATVAAGGSWSCTPATSLPDGPHSLTATQADPAGNVSPGSAPIEITVDTAAPPAPVVTGPPAGPVGTGTPTVSGTGEPGATVTLRDGATVACTATVAVDGLWSCTPATALSDGPHSLTATQADPAGNASPASAPVAVTVDTVAPPAPQISGPANGTILNSTDPNPEVTGTGSPGDRIDIVDNGQLACTTTVRQDGTWACTPAPLFLAGQHQLGVSETDLVGNRSDAAQLTVVKRPVSDLAVSASTSPSSIPVGGTSTITVTVANLGPDVDTSVTVTDPIDGAVRYVSSTTSSGSYEPATGVWTVGDLSQQEGATLTVTVTGVSPGVATVPFVASGTLFDIAAANDSTSVAMTVTAAPALLPPPSAPTSVSPSGASMTEDEALPSTGTDAPGVVTSAAALISVGVALLLLGRRRRRHSASG